MPAQRVITQVVESDPLFVTISHQPNWFALHCVGGGIHWQHLSVDAALEQETLALIEEAHRVVLDVAACTPPQREALIARLSPYQNKLKIILPLYSFWQLAVSGEIPQWSLAYEWQKTHVLHWTSLLPEATIIFIRDVVDWQSPLLLSLLLVQHWSAGLVLVPEGNLAVTKKNELIGSLMQEFGAPSKGSVLLEATSYALATLFEQALPVYESMYQTRIHQQRVATTRLELLPFACRVREIHTTLSQSVEHALTLLPTPSEAAQLDKQRQEMLQHLQDDPWLAAAAAQQPAPSVMPASQHPPTPDSPAPTATALSVSKPIASPTTSTQPPVSSPSTPPHTSPPVVNPPTSLEQPDPPVPEAVALPAAATVTEAEKEQQLKEDIQKLFSVQGVSQHHQTIVRKSRQRRVVKKRSRKQTIVFYLGLTFVSIGLLFAALLGTLQITQQLVRQEFVAVASGITQSPTAASSEIRWGKLPLLFSLLRPQQQLASLVFSLPMVDTGAAMLEAERLFREALTTRDTVTTNVVALYDIATGRTTGDIGTTIEVLTTTLQSATDLTDQLDTTIAQFPEPMSQPLASAAAQLLPTTERRRNDILTKTLLPKLAPLFGADGIRRYAVVLQNSQELRPTGGFIEAIAMLTFNEGSLIGTDVYSSYQLDTRIPGQVKPPQDLTASIGESQWWLHDANWFADGAASGRQVSWFLEKTLNQAPDGVIFINTAGLPRLLRALGPLEVQEFNEVLTEKNIDERLEFHNELPSQVVAGKPEYRQVLLEQLLYKLTTLPAEQVPTFLETLATLAQEKQLLFFLPVAENQQVFRQLGWTGDLTFPTCPAAYVETGCVSDGLALVESNIGANRANAYITRSQTHKAVLSPSGVRHERIIQYTNSATTRAWPKGDYRLYLRAYIPGQPTNIAVTLAGTQVNPADIAVRSTEFGAEVALIVTVPVASTSELKLTYDQNQTLSPTSTYVFYENRQAGLTEDIPELVLQYPQEWQVASHLPPATTTAVGLVFPPSPTSYLMRVVQFTPAQ